MKMILWREEGQDFIGVAVLARDIPPQAYRVVPRKPQDVNSDSVRAPCGIPQRFASIFLKYVGYLQNLLLF